MKSNALKRTALTAVITLSTASVYFAQTTQDSIKSKEIDGVVLTGVADIAKDRKTPVAVSTIKEAQIVEKLGNQEFPEILNTTPSVYATKSGGGFGDSRINIRGFGQENIAVLINGVPVNDMENGRVYWSNWAGLSDVTSAMQVQRGLGSSKLAIASVGGTINVLTRSADKKRQGKVALSVGNDGYHKALFSYNTGKSEAGWSSSFLMSRTAGSTYADGTESEGYNYYFALGFQPNRQHDLQFTITGAPQWHNQRRTSVTIYDAIKYGGSEETPNRRYNADWGYLTGADGVAREYSLRRNYYHKPVMSLNWDWKISRESKLSTVLYASFGRGGGTRDLGSVWNGKFKDNKGSYKPDTRYVSQIRNADGLINFDDVIAYNIGAKGFNPNPYAAGELVTITDPNGKQHTINSGVVRAADINSHNWFGALSSFNHKLNDNLNFTLGVDARYYKGYHHRVVNDLLGNTSYTDNSNANVGPNVITNTYSANPNWNPFGGKEDPIQDKIVYSNDGVVKWIGGFGQLEYTNDVLSAFVQGSLSNQGFQRIDNFYKEGTKEWKATTDTKNLLGYNVKGGANFNIDNHNNIFANVGYYERQPFFGAVYLNNTNELNKNLTNEKVFSVELGYGYRSRMFNANLNAYRTVWNDQFSRYSWTDATTGQRYTANLLGLNELHQGLELDFNVKPIDILQVNGMVSVGDYYYNNNPKATFFDEQTNQATSETTLDIKNVKVGNTAQMTASIGATLKPTEWFSFNVDYRYADKLYSGYDPTKGGEPIKLPSFGLVDMGATYTLKLNNSQTFTFRGNVNNVFDKVYISDMYTNYEADAKNPANNWKGINKANAVYFGFGRTWNASVSFTF
ncbi:TonB-dependent receptor [Riemerella columbina]|uniref:TonB-dependent receptor n=1 Tax=Riemerella columbina TaxID=103810 RepID=UPI00036DC122|nr:TonB-dependent receptor plug domain-containing protein [Riemerella columbina]